MTYYSHPLTKDQITEENYREVASGLLDYQLLENIHYHAMVLKFGWSDDDTDYMRTGLNATESLMDIAYDGSRQDLIDFLFTPRRVYDVMDPKALRHEPLHTIDSAGGLCAALRQYADPLYEEEDE